MQIYKITNLINGKVYVGKDSLDNPNYLGSGILIVQAIEKYGKEKFKKEVIDAAIDKEILNLKEEYWISYFNSKFPNGYNLTDGGDGGDLSKFYTYRPLSGEEKKVISERTKEAMQNLSPEEKEKFSRKGKIPWNKDLKMSQEFCDRLSIAHKGRHTSWQKGLTKETDERVRKLALTKVGKPRPDIAGDKNPMKKSEVKQKRFKSNTK